MSQNWGSGQTNTGSSTSTTNKYFDPAAILGLTNYYGSQLGQQGSLNNSILYGSSAAPAGQIAHLERIARFARRAPGVVFVQPFHLAELFEILRLHRNGAAHMRRHAELLPCGILHPVDAVQRHSPTL